MNIYPSLLLILLFSASCASIDPALITKDQMTIVVSRAREKVADAKNEITDGDKLFIRANQPELSYYILSGTYAQHIISWHVDAFHRVVVLGQGDIMTLEGATVKKFKMKE